MNAPRPPAEPLVDQRAISIYCEIVFGYLDGLVPIRLLAEAGTGDRKPRFEFPTTENLSKRIVAISGQAAEQKLGVFVVPGTVAKSGSARAADIVQCGTILVDLDDGDIAAKREHLVRHIGPPSLEVASGGTTEPGQAKLHLYWRLTEAAACEALQRVAETRRLVAEKVGGDTAFGSLHQPIRVAGTIHGKNARRSPVRLLAHSACEYELAELAEAVRSMPGAGAPDKRRDRSGPTARQLATTRVRAGCRDGVTRFEALSRVIGHHLRNVRSGHSTLEEAWRAVQDHNATMIVPSWEPEKLRREFEALSEKDVAEKGPLSRPERHPLGQDGSPHRGPAFSEDAIAAELVSEHGRDWRHVAAWSVWYRWNGQVWQRDEKRLVHEHARRVCRAVAKECRDAKDQRRIASHRTITSVLRIAASDPRVATAASDWDAHPMLLNTRAGVIDLESGEVLPHDPSLLLSQITSASVGADCPGWMAFLDEFTNGDANLQAYLARLAGYCLTGDTSEQVFVFFHGQGANGKSVLLQSLASVLGSYAATSTLDTFMARRGDRHLTELAGLRAARLVLVSETETGRNWAEARIKTVTGGEKIRANFMRQDHFEYTPQFKLLIAGNHRPSLGSVGEAMRRRLQLVPCTVTIPPERRDPRFVQKLLTERDAILGWALAGCAEWQRIGLAPPDSVTAAAEEYFETEDVVGQWMADCCVRGNERKAPSSVLFQSWRAWAEIRGFDPGSQKWLGEALRSRGLRSGTVNRSRGWIGIAVRTGKEDRG